MDDDNVLPFLPRTADPQDFDPLAALTAELTPEVWRAIVSRAVRDAQEGDGKARAWITGLLRRFRAPPVPRTNLSGTPAERAEKVRCAINAGIVTPAEGIQLLRSIALEQAIQGAKDGAGEVLTAEQFVLLRAQIKSELLQGSGEDS